MPRKCIVVHASFMPIRMLNENLQMSLNGLTKEQVLAQYSDRNITLKDKVITIPEGALYINWPNAPEDSSYGTNPEKWYSYG